jgi:hypothetical protein
VSDCHGGRDGQVLLLLLLRLLVLLLLWLTVKMSH